MKMPQKQILLILCSGKVKIVLNITYSQYAKINTMREEKKQLTKMLIDFNISFVQKIRFHFCDCVLIMSRL